MVHDMAMKDEKLKGMGTTVIICIIRDDTAHILHAGDSRVYIADADSIQQVTKDHSIVQMLIESGELTEAEAVKHPKKHYITRALGVEKTLDAEYTECEINEGQKLLLCTDGLTNHLEDEAIREVLFAGAPEEAPQRLIDMANKHGGTDNITAVVLY